MKKAKVIIGGGFGDEGKGLFTDYLSAQSSGSACVVRFNGGAQAGHSVQLADGRRHVFSHFGSGTYAGLPTFLSSFFVCSPMTFLREYKELKSEGCFPKTYIDPDCPVTTPYDIMINQIVEQARGNDRHGSVGVGFGETIERNQHASYALTVRDLADVDALCVRLEAIRSEWLPRRLATLGVTTLTSEWAERLESEGIFAHFLDDCTDFLGRITVATLRSLSGFDDLIFEGAQGLLLDQHYGWFPHVTRSNTGIKNAVALAETIGLAALDVYYLTRSYVTRHGAGPLPHELPEQPYSKIIDPTNRSHAYQGELRFAWFDVDLFRDTVERDLKSCSTPLVLRPHLGMSCLDQIDGAATYIAGGIKHATSPEGLLDVTCKAIGAQAALASYGPTRHTIHKRTSRPTVRSNIRRSYELLQTFGVAQDDALVAVG